MEMPRSNPVFTDEDMERLIEAREKGEITETEYLLSIPGVYESILQAMNEPIEEGMPLEDYKWDGE